MFAQSKTAMQVVSGDGVADAIDFDGTNDYLSRSSDLVGNADGKAFTFSAWVWWGGSSRRLLTNFSSSGIDLYIDTSTKSLNCYVTNQAGSAVLSFTVAMETPLQTFVHVLVSVDLSNTANRFVYVNDTLSSVTWTTYINDAIDFTKPTWVVAASAPGSTFKGRLSNVFLDYTYLNLSIEANRRLFITAARKPAKNQAALNPILYLPLNDPTQPGKNLGTGGDFALTGVVARSGRGPSQFNAPYSDFDGAADYLSRTTAPSGIADGKQFTFGCVFNLDNVSTGNQFFTIGDGTSRFAVVVTSNYVRIVASNPANTTVLTVNTDAILTVGRNYLLVVSIDLSDIAKRAIYINGVDKTPTSGWTYVNDVIDFTMASYRVGCSQATPTPNGFVNGRLGNVFFDTKYIDLSQPANLVKFVTGTGIDAKPADLGANGELPFGTPPLIYLPMYGNNAGKNYGTGGDFTVNSGPYPGARGPNEFWGNKADFDGVSTTNLKKTGVLSGVAASKTFSASFFVRFSAIDTTRRSVLSVASTSGADGALYLYAYNGGTPTFYIYGRSGASSVVLAATFTVAVSTNYFVQISVDLNNSANRMVYVNGVATAVTWNTYTNSTMDFNRVSSNSYIGSSAFPETISGSLAEMYFTTEYIDFSQEANRLKFRDAFGNPVDLAPQINAGTLPNPVIYMRFDPANLGKNSGTGGDFTVNGTITDGGQL